MRSADLLQPRRTPQAQLREEEWKEFLLENCSQVFQTALLLSADPRTAEAALIEGVEELDLCRPPGQSTRVLWERAVVMRSVAPRESGRSLSIHPFIQPGLWPVIGIERFPRICFVLRRLLKYPVTSCAQILGIEEGSVQALLQAAMLQLQHGTAANDLKT